MKQTVVYQLQDLNYVVGLLKKQLDCCKIIAFSGVLGAGKTTIIKSLLYACGVYDLITSPTFTYVHVYTNDKGELFYHFDLYRIKTMEEFLALGFDEYLYAPNSWAIIEWPEVIMSLLVKKVCFVTVDYHGNSEDTRVITITK